MKISILCSSDKHPVNVWLEKWVETNSPNHEILMFREVDEIIGGDLLFLISCTVIVSHEIRCRFKKTLIIHASDLPEGRGWSPHIWDLLKGKSEIILSLIEAEDKVDSGDIWTKLAVTIPSTDLYDEINNRVFQAELKLMDYAIQKFRSIKPTKQNCLKKTTYYPKRTPKDSELNVNLSICDQFDLMRVCDPERYPSFFYYGGEKYYLYLKKSTNDK